MTMLPKPKTTKKKSRVTRTGRVLLNNYDYFLLKAAVREYQGNRCADCGTPNPADLHHIKKRKMGGSGRDDSAANVKLLCRECRDLYSDKLQFSAKEKNATKG